MGGGAVVQVDPGEVGEEFDPGCAFLAVEPLTALDLAAVEEGAIVNAHELVALELAGGDEGLEGLVNIVEILFILDAVVAGEVADVGELGLEEGLGLGVRLHRLYS